MKPNTTAGRPDSRFLAELERILGHHNHEAHSRTGRIVRHAATDTRRDRVTILTRAFTDLYRLGYKVRTPGGLKDKHVRALMDHWQDKGLALSTLHKRLAILRVFARWIGKGDMIGDIDRYVAGDTRRPIATTKNKAWEANGADTTSIIERARVLDPRMALYLSLQDAFGLRTKEAIELKPLRAVTITGTHLEVSDGTKGGRPRVIPIDTDERRRLIAQARELASASRNKAIRWPDCTWKQAQRRYYHLAAKLGITKKELGVTPHGLRHGDAQREYKRITGQPTPIEGGARGRIDPKLHRQAAQMVALRLGHGRGDVGGFYYGSYGHGLRLNLVDALKGGAV